MKKVRNLKWKGFYFIRIYFCFYYYFF
jgi:hypothetical protein